MREILFRAKRTDNGEWIEGYYAKQSNHACFAHELKYQHFIFKDVCLDFNLGGLQEFEIIPETVGQYTGLTDKNGVRIFEGDIIQSLESSVTGLVQWFPEHSAFMVWCKSANEVGFLYECADIIKVIGNIHDNPELLEGGEGE